jgi:REP element-mobilizing transposase RayT
MAVYHVMARGNGGQNIVSGHNDWKGLFDVFAAVKRTSDFRLYAYCLMGNHFHALVRVMTDPLSHFMHRIQTTWAKRFNLRHERKGHVFQQRFKSKYCGNDTEYCRWLLRYIHYNPVKDGLTNRPENWEWSSYRQYLGQRSGIADIEWPLSLFGGNVPMFEDFVLQGAHDPRELREMEDSRVSYSGPIMPFDEIAPVGRLDLDEIAHAVAAESGVSIEALLGSGRLRTISTARRLLALRAISAGHQTAAIAQKLSLDPSAISHMLGARH